MKDAPEGGVEEPRVSSLAGQREGLPAALTEVEIDACLRPALDEDLGSGDLTSQYSIPAEARARARLVSKAPGRLAGLSVFARAFELLDPSARIELEAEDGDAVRPGLELCLPDPPGLMEGPVGAS